DLCMPRGGEGLIRAVAECSKVPVIKHYKGVCHVFVDRDADLAMAREIALNAKLQRPAVCNAVETLLVDRPVAEPFLRALAPSLAESRVEVRADEHTRSLLAAAAGAPNRSFPLQAASEQDWFTEYNDAILNGRVRDGLASP